MTGLVYALAVALIASSAAVFTFAVWGRRDSRALLNAADLLDGQRKLVAEYKSKYDLEYAAHTVTSTQLKQERDLRGVAEAQRNEAQRRVGELLRQHMGTATDDEIRALTAHAFSSPLSIVPSLPKAADSSANRDALIDPFV